MASRYYQEGVRQTLFTFSNGRCYHPSCSTPVIKFVGGNPRVNVQIAHIYAKEKNGPRYNLLPSGWGSDEFRNLMLLCQSCHAEIDSPLTCGNYPPELLLKWKADHEGDSQEVLRGLDGLTEQGLEEIFQDAMAHVVSGISEALDEFSKVNEDAAATIRGLLSPENVELLYRTSMELQGLDESATTLYAASVALRGLDENANMLHVASRDLRGLEGNASMLHWAGQDLSNLEGSSFMLHEASENLKGCKGWVNELADSVKTLSRLQDCIGDFGSAAKTLANQKTQLSNFVSAMNGRQKASWPIGEQTMWPDCSDSIDDLFLPASSGAAPVPQEQPVTSVRESPTYSITSHFQQFKFRYGVATGMIFVIALELFGVYLSSR